ncbi:MAG: TonB-dependent receptor [Ignavibacterium sp.]|jgi:hypothetical protein
MRVLHNPSAVLAAFGCAAVLFWIPAFSQPSTITVTGEVVEAGSGEALAGFHVLAYRDSVSGAFERGTATNRWGVYSLTGLTPGVYVLRTSGVGYETAYDTLRLGSSARMARVDIELRQIDIRLQEIVVQSAVDPLPTRSISRLTLRPEFIRQMPALGGEPDVFRSIQLLPGVKTVSEVSSGLYIRGGSPDQNLTLLDGVAIHNPFHLGGFMSAFHGESLKDVRVMKAVVPADYGGRMSGVVDLTSKDGSQEKIGGGAGISLINSRLFLEGPLGEDGRFMLAGRRVYLDLVLSLFFNPADVPTYYFYDLNLKVQHRISPSNTITVSGYFGRDVLGEPSDSFRNFEIFWGNSGGTVRWTHIASPALFLNTSITHSRYRFLMDLSDGHPLRGFKSTSVLSDFILRCDAEYIPDADHRMKGGVEMTFHSIEASYVDFLEGPRGNHEPPVRTFRPREVAGFVLDEWAISERLSANVGVRFASFQNGGFLRGEPRILASYAVTKDFKVNAGYSRAYQFLQQVSKFEVPLPSDIWFPATSVVRPGRSDNVVIGIEGRPWERDYVFRAEAYYRRIHNIYEFKNGVEVSDILEFESLLAKGRGESFGLELYLEKQTGSLTGWIGYTLSKTSRRFPGVNSGRAFPPRHDRLHDFATALTYRLSKGWEFGATWIFASGQPYTVPSGQFGWGRGSRPQLLYNERNNYRLSAFHKLDLTFIRKFSLFGLPAEFSINIYNAYASPNPFTQIIEFRSSYDTGTGEVTWEPRVQEFTLFPFLPTFGLSVRF